MKTERSLELATMKHVSATVVAGLSLLIPAAVGLFIPGAPSALGPLPAITVTPAFFLPSPAIAVAVPALLFFVWNPGLFRGESRVPTRSYWLLAVATVLSVIWFVTGWKYGLRYQGARYVYEVCAANIAGLSLLAIVFSRYGKSKPSFGLNLALHWLLFVWLAWYAFPYLGELP